MTESEYMFVCNCMRVRTALTLLTESLEIDGRVRQAVRLLSDVQQNHFEKLEDMEMDE